MSKSPNKCRKRVVSATIPEKLYQEFQTIVKQDSTWNLSKLIRSSLLNQPVEIRMVPEYISPLMELLCSIDSQLRELDAEMNQVIEMLYANNTTSLDRFLLSRKVLEMQQELQSIYSQMETILSQLQVKWLS